MLPFGPRVLSLSITALLLVGCAAQEENVEDATQDINGGSNTVEPPTVYFFEAGGDRPRCAGAIIGEKVAITARSCAREGMIVTRAGVSAKARITEVHAPDGDGADLAVVKLDRKLGSVFAVITHAPLRDGYTVNSATSGSGRAAVASVAGQMVSETDMHGAIVPRAGQLCSDDVGAPVCSSVKASFMGAQVVGTCGLAGIVVGPPDPAPATPATNGTTTPSPAPAVTPTQTVEERSCPTGAWKVAQVGRHAEFIRRFAPEAFEPIEFERPFFGRSTFAPDGLWGFKSNGAVRSCKIETATLAPAALKAESRITAKVSFSGMQERAAAWGRIGIAPKSAPTQMRWLPAQARDERKGSSFETTFEGAVSSDRDGDFIVAFRASANGGETWTQCDLDGAENGFSVEKALPLKVGAGDQAGVVAPQQTPPSPTLPSEESDPAPEDSPSEDLSTAEEEPSDTDKPKKAKKAAQGCSAAPHPAPASTLPLLGLGLAATLVLRRRRR